jgi:hypothetical protein
VESYTCELGGGWPRDVTDCSEPLGNMWKEGSGESGDGERSLQHL